VEEATPLAAIPQNLRPVSSSHQIRRQERNGSMRSGLGVRNGLHAASSTSVFGAVQRPVQYKIRQPHNHSGVHGRSNGSFNGSFNESTNPSSRLNGSGNYTPGTYTPGAYTPGPAFQFNPPNAISSFDQSIDQSMQIRTGTGRPITRMQVPDPQGLREAYAAQFLRVRMARDREQAERMEGGRQKLNSLRHLALHHRNIDGATQSGDDEEPDDEETEAEVCVCACFETR
jgi:hypothetical protein